MTARGMQVSISIENLHVKAVSCQFWLWLHENDAADPKQAKQFIPLFQVMIALL
jgi:hypothetical protein